jgi:hypothetical protein
MEKFYDDFLIEWKKIRGKTKNSDVIIEELRKKIDLKNLSPDDMAVGKPSDTSKKKK